MIRRGDGHLVVISDESVCEYASEENFDEGRTESSIVFH